MKALILSKSMLNQDIPGSIVSMEAPIHVSNVKKVEAKKAAAKKKETKVEDAKIEEKTTKKTTAKKTTKKVKES